MVRCEDDMGKKQRQIQRHTQRQKEMDEKSRKPSLIDRGMNERDRQSSYKPQRPNACSPHRENQVPNKTALSFNKVRIRMSLALS